MHKTNYQIFILFYLQGALGKAVYNSYSFLSSEWPCESEIGYERMTGPWLRSMTGELNPVLSDKSDALAIINHTDSHNDILFNQVLKISFTCS